MSHLTDQGTGQPARTTVRQIAQMWWPLALSFLLMSLEGPAHNAIVARLANPEINLAAWGGIVFPVALIIESPGVMMLSASTALSKDWETYRKLRRIAVALGIALTLIHISVAFTPLYDLVAQDIIGVPKEILEPGRIGLMIMTPWCWGITFRRFQQGAMIRFGHTKAVGIGTVVRISSVGLVLLIGYLLQRVPGIVVASSAVAVGVSAEALYAGLRVRPIVRTQIRCAPRNATSLTLRSFLSFYVPLAITSLIFIFVSPIASAAISRMPEALNSLAVLPVITGLTFVLRSPGLAYNEVVVAVLDEPHAYQRLRRFAILLGSALLIVVLIIVASPLADLWLGVVMALPTQLLPLARQALWLSVLLPPLALVQSWYQGIIVNSKRTGSIIESVTLYLVITVITLGIGMLLQSLPGLLVTIIAFNVATFSQVAWLWHRSRPVVKALSPELQVTSAE